MLTVRRIVYGGVRSGGGDYSETISNNTWCAVCTCTTHTHTHTHLHNALLATHFLLGTTHERAPLRARALSLSLLLGHTFARRCKALRLVGSSNRTLLVHSTTLFHFSRFIWIAGNVKTAVVVAAVVMVIVAAMVVCGRARVRACVRACGTVPVSWLVGCGDIVRCGRC